MSAHLAREVPLQSTGSKRRVAGGHLNDLGCATDSSWAGHPVALSLNVSSVR